jgi:ribosome-binding factor A
MEDLVARAREADARLAAVREGAVPAGDPDPYREPPGATADDELDDDEDGLADDEDDLLGGTSAAADRGAGYSPP